jgi:hypothetical protein
MSNNKIKNFTILSKLGKGAFGTAFKVEDESKFFILNRKKNFCNKTVELR